MIVGIDCVSLLVFMGFSLVCCSLHQFHIVQLKAPVEQRRFRTVETGEQEEASIRVGRQPVAFIPLPRVRLFPEPKRRVRFLTRQESVRLLHELPSHLADLAAFTLATGLRQSNATQLRWDQVDRSRGVAWIHPDQSKSRKAIAVPLNEDAMVILARRWGRHDVYVFTYRGAPVLRTSTKAWYKALQRAGIENFRWHDLRHTWASWHVQNGTSLQELQELGG